MLRMDTKRRAVGLMGGTFNPIHYGHLVTAEAARDAFHLDRVIFIPSGHPPHKAEVELASAEHRYLMTFLAIAPNVHFELSRVEIERQGPSYTSETLRFFYEQDESVDWFFITGADAIFEIASWHYPENIFRYAELIAASRPGYSLTRLQALAQQLGADRMHRIHQLEVPALAISSSLVRDRIQSGLSIKYLVPDAVEQYIGKNVLYQGTP